MKRKINGVGRKRLNTVRLKYREARKEGVTVRNSFAAFAEEKFDGGRHGKKGATLQSISEI